VYSGFILPLLQVHLEQIGLMWRILLVGTDGFSFRSARCLFYFRCLNYHTLNPDIVINAFWDYVVWNGLSIVSLYSLLDPGCKCGLFEFSCWVCSTKLSDLAHFQGTWCLVVDKCPWKRVNSDDSATHVCGCGGGATVWARDTKRHGPRCEHRTRCGHGTRSGAGPHMKQAQ
jgi:hypothetical protein